MIRHTRNQLSDDTRNRLDIQEAYQKGYRQALNEQMSTGASECTQLIQYILGLIAMGDWGAVWVYLETISPQCAQQIYDAIDIPELKKWLERAFPNNIDPTPKPPKPSGPVQPGGGNPTDPTDPGPDPSPPDPSGGGGDAPYMLEAYQKGYRQALNEAAIAKQICYSQENGDGTYTEINCDGSIGETHKIPTPEPDWSDPDHYLGKGIGDTLGKGILNIFNW